MEQNKEKPLDRRQKKTRLAIQTALMALMKDKPLEKITISELTATADVNRKTFYNNYSSIQDVRKELNAQYVDILFSFMDNADLNALAMDPAPFITHMVTAMVNQPIRARLVFESGEHLYLAERTKKLILPYLAKLAAKQNVPANLLNYTLEYVVSGTLAILNTWVHADYPIPPKQLEQMMTALIRSSAAIVIRSEEPEASL